MNERLEGVVAKLATELQLAENHKGIAFYAIGSYEDHGAISPDVDRVQAEAAAQIFSKLTGGTFLGTLPHSTNSRPDSAAWNWSYMSPDRVADGIVRAVDKQKMISQILNKSMPRKIFLVSGHGGNDVMKGYMRRLFRRTGIGFEYIEPYLNVKITDERLAVPFLTHNDHAENSVAKFLGILNEPELKFFNSVAAEDPKRALMMSPSNAGLGYWSLLYDEDDKYDYIRKSEKGLKTTAEKFVEQDKMIVADEELGERFFTEWIRNGVRFIQNRI